MNLLEELSNPSLSRSERAELRCCAAAELIHIGQYEQAQIALGELWQGIGNRPQIERLSFVTSAEVLLQSGVLSGWLGTVKPVPVQDKAKDLISEALHIFQNKKLRVKVSEAQYELGICYWREGAYEEARIILKQALEGAKDELRAKILIRRTIVENCTGRYHDAWEILREAQSFFESCNDTLKGKWHGQLGLVLQRLALTEKREDYVDRAVMEFTAAIFHYEQAGNQRYVAMNLNNLAMLLYPMGRHLEAYESLDKAERIFRRFNDPGSIAQVQETRARALVSEQRYEEAYKVISNVVSILEQGREYALLSDALIIQGVVAERLKQHEHSVNILNRALRLAEDCGSFLNAGVAAITLIEEHSKKLSEAELNKLYLRADWLLKNTQDFEYISRLLACASIVIKKLLGPQLSDSNFHLPTVLRIYEARFIERALDESGGSVSRAAKLLGFKHHGSLANLLQNKHKDLEHKRTPPTPRKSIIKTFRKRS